MSDFDLSQTYLYKLHTLTNDLNKLFDQVLRSKTQLGLTQFLFLLSVRQHDLVSSKKVAQFLSLSPAAISRQVAVAHRSGWVQHQSKGEDRRAQLLFITAAGDREVKKGITALENEVLHVFKDEDKPTSLMEHIDLLTTNIRTTDNS
jgi:DNA-binding MarR family transcriptional regulator